jgi:hypothetical protein
MGNSESKPPQNKEPELQNPITTHWNAVNGDTDAMVSSTKPTPPNHAAFETTSEEQNFTQSEVLAPMPIVNTNLPVSELKGGFNLSFIFNKLSSLLQDTEMEGGITDSVFMNNQLSKIKDLLQDTEVAPLTGGVLNSFDMSHLDKIRNILNETETNNLVGGANSNDVMINKLRDLLLQDTEVNYVNFKGGALNNTNLFSELKESDEKSEASHSEHKKEEHKKEKEEKEEEQKVEEQKEEEQKEEEQKEEEDQNTDQSGGEELDTELKGILRELQANKNANSHKGGKSSKKNSKKSKSSKKQSRRSTTEASNASNNTYNIDDSDDEDYLTSTSSMNTEDINIRHYRS